jgi:GxxExxY protein
MEIIIPKIVEIAKDVFDSLGPGYNEVIYHKALEVGLRINGFNYQSEVITPIFYKGYNVGHGRADIIVNCNNVNIVLELKAVNNINNDAVVVQIKNYMNNINDGLIINFGKTFEVKYINKLESLFKIYTYNNGLFEENLMI